ncbi:SYW [Enterospora canceri]|uniref:tryptophan--tRNA ligase n=1 Tax=Enterospora canceri TaxID=1081671 RepID=A0A1Y1S8T7_9MICR|nr:SYW [Enterospora canceri]
MTESNRPQDDSKTVVTPWEVVAEEGKLINYDHIIEQFGCQKLTRDHITDLEKCLGENTHPLLRRLLCFAHRDFDKIIELIKEKKKFYMYTGRGPSSESMHIGHAVPFLLCKYFQDVFKCPIVIQITDDEKFIFKENLTLEDSIKYGMLNIRDIIAFGFDPKLTYIFSNYKSSSIFEKNTLKISKLISLNEAFKVFGFGMNSSIGMAQFPAKEIAPAYSSSFPFLEKNTPVLIPAAVDQDPYFRLARHKANILGELKPTSLYVSLLPDLRGPNRKMSASDENSSIFLSDTPEEIERKIRKHAFSGGQATLAEQREKGACLDSDVSYQYLKYFMEDEDRLHEIGRKYSKGEMSTADIKTICVEEVQRFVRSFQESRKRVSDDQVAEFMDLSKK